MAYVIQLASRIRTFCPDPARKLSANLYDIPSLCVQWKTPDDAQRNCLKHVEFYSKNKFEKLVHLFGFIIRMYHNARLPERHTIAYITKVFKFLLHIPAIPQWSVPWQDRFCFMESYDTQNPFVSLNSILVEHIRVFYKNLELHIVRNNRQKQ